MKWAKKKNDEVLFGQFLTLENVRDYAEFCGIIPDHIPPRNTLKFLVLTCGNYPQTVCTHKDMRRGFGKQKKCKKGPKLVQLPQPSKRNPARSSSRGMCSKAAAAEGSSEEGGPETTREASHPQATSTPTLHIPHLLQSRREQLMRNMMGNDQGGRHVGGRKMTWSLIGWYRLWAREDCVKEANGVVTM